VLSELSPVMLFYCMLPTFCSSHLAYQACLTLHFLSYASWHPHPFSLFVLILSTLPFFLSGFLGSSPLVLPFYKQLTSLRVLAYAGLLYLLAVLFISH
jgi:hypothetical protein